VPVESSTAPPGLILLAGVLGVVLGSFLNVCILRWGAEPKQSVVRPPSRCPRCGAGVAWYDNVPIFSWLVLRGRCRRCGEPISVQYPLIELATALMWAFLAWHYGWTLDALRAAIFGTILLGIAMTDARAYIIPDEFTLGGLVLGLLFALSRGWPVLREAVLGAVAGFAILWVFGAGATWVIRRFRLLGGGVQEAMGGGDIKMMAMVGAFLGWKGVLLTIFLGALFGCLVFVPLTLAGRRALVPFGIFLALGAAVAYLVGPAIWAWYLGSLGVT
jgi:leader peptidase (prepilin peptidase) / N-methyltransferase